MDAPLCSRTIGLILLAAGESRRMGRAKQLLPFAGMTLIRHACQTALATVARPVVVVLGAHSDACLAEVVELPVTCVVNLHWAEGMGGSLRAGLIRLTDLAPQVDGAVVMLVDQPRVGPAELATLLADWNPPRWTIAAAAYLGVLGVPAVFARSLFQELTDLQGEMGARSVIARHAADTMSVDIPAAAYDADTLGDYEQILGDFHVSQ